MCSSDLAGLTTGIILIVLAIASVILLDWLGRGVRDFLRGVAAPSESRAGGRHEAPSAADKCETAPHGEGH